MERGKIAQISHSGSFGISPVGSLALISEVIIGLSKITAKLTTSGITKSKWMVFIIPVKLSCK